MLNLFELSAEHNARLRAVSSRLEVVQVDDSLLDNLNEPEAEVVFASSPPPAHGTPRLRWLQVSSAGIDHMAKSTIWSRDVTVTNARGVYSVAMAEYVMSAVLSVSQRMDDRRALQTARHWPAYGEFSLRAVRGRTMVVVGYGTVGRETARLAKAFGMRVVAVKAHPGKPEDESFRQPGTGDPDGTLPERIVGFEGLSDALQEADYLVVTVPLTPNTDGLITRQLLEQVRPTTWLINVSRGKVIDESALMVNPNSAQAGTVPAQPATPTAAPGNGRAIVTWSPPANGGQPITGYTITGTPGGTAVAGGSATAAVVFGLTNGTSYTFTVTARNVVGTGPPSAPSNAVVPNSRLVAPSSPAPSSGRPPVTPVPPQPPPPRIVWLQPGARLEG